MADNVMAPKTLLVDLPSELREEIMRYLLVSPRAPDTRNTELGRFPCTACSESALFARKRDEMRGPYQIHSAILLTCRDLYTNALKVLRENKICSCTRSEHGLSGLASDLEIRALEGTNRCQTQHPADHHVHASLLQATLPLAKFSATLDVPVRSARP